ncbi:MAG: hypothetical protein Aurels2KO_14460 [Aureliella sp.]
MAEPTDSSPPGQPIEEAFRYCPNCGTASDAPVGEARRPFRCSSCEYTNWFGPVLAVGALIENAQGQLLLVRRAREPGLGKWGLPGGFVDQGESADQAAAREVMEEVGLAIESLDYMYSAPNWYNYQGFVAPVVDIFFRAVLHTPKDVKLAVEELDLYEWAIPSEKHLENMAFESNRLALEFWSKMTREKS